MLTAESPSDCGCCHPSYVGSCAPLLNRNTPCIQSDLSRHKVVREKQCLRQKSGTWPQRLKNWLFNHSCVHSRAKSFARSKLAMTFEEFGDLVGKVAAYALGIPLILVSVLVAYWLVVVILRLAGVIELPDPINLLPVEWRQKLPIPQ